MKIRYKLKHWFFRFSRAFYHARKLLAVFGLCIALVLCAFPVSAAQETVRTYLSADNELLYKSHSDIEGIGTPDHFLLSLDRGTWEDKYPYQAWCTYRNKYTANTSDGWSDSTFISPLPNFTTENYRIDVKDVLNRGFSEDCYQFRLGIQTKNSTNSEPGFQDTFPYLMTGKACSFSVEFYSSWGFAAVKSAKFIVRMYYVDPMTQNISYVYFYTANYNVSQYSDTQTLAATFTIFNKTGRTLNLAGVYIDFEAGANSWKNFSGNYGFGRLKYHQFTDDEWLAYQDDISRRAQTDALLNVGVDPKPPAGSGAVDDLDKAEDALLGDTEEGFSRFDAILDATSGYIETYASAFAGVGNFFMDIAYIPFFTSLLYISLTFGLFALLVNLGVSALGFHRGAVRRKEAAKARANAAAQSRKKGGGK